ncbi:DUF805 domain-containing protein [Gemella sanguinis]|uniref:DUF805 domain-containing protein n=1 Tax=Gemella sanguinis TaxID=84135 RepID=UPI00352D0307
MINQRQKPVTYGSAFNDFFKGFVEFTGYTTRAGHWFPFGTIYGATILIFIIFFGSVFSSFIGISSRASRSSNYLFSNAGSDILSTASNALIFLIIMCIILFILAIPTTASFARRLRDVGFAAWGIVVTIVLFYILNIFTIYIVTFLYDICFIFVLMSLPTNCLETDKNDDFSKFFFRQTVKAQQYYGQFNNNGQTFYQGQNGGQFNQYGQPMNGQPNFQNGQQPYNPNFQGNNGYQGYNGQNPQGHGQQSFDQYGQPINPNYQGHPNQGFNPNGPRPQQPTNQGQPNHGVNPNQGFNPNGPRPQQPVNQGYPNQGFNPNGPRPQQPVNQGQPHQEQNPNAPRPQQPTNQGPVNQGVNPNHQEQSPVKEAPKPQETVQKQEVPTPEVKETPEVNESVEVKKEVNETPSVQGGVKSRRLQKLNKPEEEQTILKRRNK